MIIKIAAEGSRLYVTACDQRHGKTYACNIRPKGPNKWITVEDIHRAARLAEKGVNWAFSKEA